jgi:hypothetical protein
VILTFLSKETSVLANFAGSPSAREVDPIFDMYHLDQTRSRLMSGDGMPILTGLSTMKEQDKS